MAIAAWAVVRLRRRSSLFWGSLGALALVVFQSLLGRGAVLSELDQEIVTAHLAAAMALLGSLVFLHVRAGAPAVFAGRGASQRFTLLAAFAALSVYALLLFGAHVRATGATLAFPDWPLFGGALLPDLRAGGLRLGLRLALGGAALLYGESMITPAISVLSCRTSPTPPRRRSSPIAPWPSPSG